MQYSMIPLHKRKDLTDDCVQLLNSEWPRSKAARLHHLEKSCETLPYSLVMLETEPGGPAETVVGYCRLAKIVNEPTGVFIESVVVDKARRGEGLGKKLMSLAESYTGDTGYSTIYLCTKDKQGFYEHIGYSFYKPVNTIGAQMLETCDCSSNTNTPLDMNNSGNNSCSSRCGERSASQTTKTNSKNKDNIEDVLSPENHVPTSPPPPPPTPPVKAPCGPTLYWMKKQLVV